MSHFFASSLGPIVDDAMDNSGVRASGGGATSGRTVVIMPGLERLILHDCWSVDATGSPEDQTQVTRYFQDCY
jgi:hypothetical protein